jgi:hypothetical protein
MGLYYYGRSLQSGFFIIIISYKSFAKATDVTIFAEEKRNYFYWLDG